MDKISELEKAIDNLDTNSVVQILSDIDNKLDVFNKIAQYVIDNDNIQILQVLIDNDLPVYSNNTRLLPIYYAISKAKYALVEFILNYCPNAVYDEYDLLHVAFEKKSFDIVKLLVNKGFNINVINKCNHCIISFADHIDDENVVRYFIENGGDCNIQIQKDCNLLVSFLTNYDKKNDNLINYLLDLGATIDGNENYLFYNGIYKHNFSGLILILEKFNIYLNIGQLIEDNVIVYPDNYYYTSDGAIDVSVSPNILSLGVDINHINSDGDTILHKAARDCDSICIDFLLDNGADINIKNNRGETPFYLAVERNDLAVERNDDDSISVIHRMIDIGVDYTVVSNKGETILHNIIINDTYLLKRLIDNCSNIINNQDNEGLTPLMVAVSLGCLNYVKLLLQYGADINMTNFRGAQAIYYAYSINLIDELLKYGADINSRRSDGNTIIYKLTTSWEYNKMVFLLENGADVSLKYSKGRTLLHKLANSKYTVPAYNNIVSELIKYGADINAIDDDGMTPLYIAVVHRRVDYIKSFIENGADINIRKNNISVLDYAKNHNLTSVIKLLESY